LQKYFKMISLLLLSGFLMATGLPVFADAVPAGGLVFTDVPSGSYAFKDINDLRTLGITGGIGNNKFGYGKPTTRGEFVTLLVRLMGWEQISPGKGSFNDNQDKTKYYYKTIETAVQHGVILKDGTSFKPDNTITREDMAVMIIRCLGYDTLARGLDYLGQPFPDVNGDLGYITIAKDLGIINGSGGKFDPKGTALKEQAAAMMMRMYNRLNAPVEDLNAFYAISSNTQQDKIADLTSVCFGWSRLTYDPGANQVILNTLHDGTSNQEYYVPEAFSARIATADQNNVNTLFSVYSSQDTKITDPQSGTQVGLPGYVLARPDVYRKVIDDIISQVNLATRGTETGSFGGVVIDFEGMKGDVLKQDFNAFLKELREKLDKSKKLYVTVPPVLSKGQPYFDGYDYRTIGGIADKIILMAHDYDAKRLTGSDMARGVTSTPLTPVSDVYYALKAITDPGSGVQDVGKIMLQISFNWVGWRTADGKTVNSVPDLYSYNNFIKLFENNITMGYSDSTRNPYISFTDSSGMQNTVWYEDTRSVTEKIKLAGMFGIKGVSLWRLGSIPDYVPADGKPLYQDVWQNILKLRSNAK
jgi:spore germination protein YaaH